MAIHQQMTIRRQLAIHYRMTAYHPEPFWIQLLTLLGYGRPSKGRRPSHVVDFATRVRDSVADSASFGRYLICVGRLR